MSLLGKKFAEEENDPTDTRMASRNLQGSFGRERRCSRLRIREKVYLLAMSLCLLPLKIIKIPLLSLGTPSDL